MTNFSHQYSNFDGPGAVRACLRSIDWQACPLGPPAAWPSELSAVVNLMLNSRFPMFVAWGPELIFLYNDDYATIMGDKHPGGLGQRFEQVWGEIWPVIAPIAADAMAGRSSYFEDLPLMIKRDASVQRAWFTFSYSPVAGSGGGVGGIYCAVVETTANVEARQVQAFQLHLSDTLRALTSSEAIVAAASESLGRATQVARVLYAEVDDERGTFYIRRDWLAKGALSVAGEIRRLDDFGPQVIARLRAGHPIAVADVFTDVFTAPFASAYRAMGVGAMVSVPLVKGGKLIAILSMHSDVARAWHDSDVRMAQEMAERTWSAVESAQAQGQLRESNQRKDEFLAMLAHELRNPLAPISAAAELMERSPQDAERVRRTSAVISRQVRHMTGLVDDLLDVSRVTRGQVTLNQAPQDMKNVVASAVEQVRPLIGARNHRLTLELPPETAQVLGDETRLVQVITNLLNNAAKYTPEGGHVRLTMATEPSQVIVRVIDDGIGIAPELQTRVFDLFAQAERTSDRSQGGLGLGLALVKSLVALHGGQVSCFSEGANCGSSFSLRLPRFEALPEPVERRKHPRLEAADANERIMIVDDNADAATMLGMLLEASGHEVMVENRSLAGLKLATEALPAICILDIGLPDMDGYELARRLREVRGLERALLIAVTGYGQESDRQRAFAAGFDHHMVKPVDAQKLLRIVAGHSVLAGV
ncbi:hybrid sensor histidine kinase/response regulator [Massilia sp. TSP1-1-2]|uniref:hybrid sensor histidine kinase/response regulator n=1 Tax=Massilia sp. TSP1-1-2 TaxID=2804649 RepID=UPI003CF3C55D